MRAAIKYILFHSLLLAAASGYAQGKQPKITNVNFIYKNEQIEITYDIVGYSNTDELTISLSAYKANGEHLNATAISGDLQNIKGGAAKKIYWQQRKDGYVFDEEIYFVVSATNKIQIPLTTHLIRNIAFPGWGDYHLRNNKYHFLFGAAGYAFIAAAVRMNQQAVSSYKNYKASFDIDKSNQLFKNAQKQQKFSYAFAGAAAVVWTVDLAGIFSKHHKVKNNITAETCKYYYAKGMEKITGNCKPQHINTNSPYDLAIERGNKLLGEEKYIEAKTAYEEAHTLKPEEELAKAKLETANKMLADIQNKEIAYNQKITEGQALIDKQQFEKSKIVFQEASTIKPKEKYPAEKINEINVKLDNLEKEAQYNENIKSGDISASKADYETAKVFYENALNLKPNDPIANSKINQMEDKLAAIAVAKKNKEYVDKMKEGDKEFGIGNYENAKAIFAQALEMKPSESAPRNKMENCDQHIYEKLIIQADVAYNKKQYDKARSLYQQASIIAPSEKYPQRQIQTIDKLLQEPPVNSKNAMTKSELFEKCKSAIFYVTNENDETISQGTGFFISKNGLAVSNYHIFKGYSHLKTKIYLPDETILSVEKVMEKSEEFDYIIFKVKNIDNRNFSFLPYTDKEPKPLEDVITIGNPDGIAFIAENGSIIKVEEDRIYHNVNITHGNSGGPLINMKGEVIGITTGGISTENREYKYAMRISKLKLWRF